jgi:hypothetical protein
MGPLIVAQPLGQLKRDPALSAGGSIRGGPAGRPATVDPRRRPPRHTRAKPVRLRSTIAADEECPGTRPWRDPGPRADATTSAAVEPWTLLELVRRREQREGARTKESPRPDPAASPDAGPQPSIALLALLLPQTRRVPANPPTEGTRAAGRVFLATIAVFLGRVGSGYEGGVPRVSRVSGAWTRPRGSTFGTTRGPPTRRAGAGPNPGGLGRIASRSPKGMRLPAQRAAEYGCRRRLAMGAFGRGRLPRGRHFLLSKEEEYARRTGPRRRRPRRSTPRRTPRGGSVTSPCRTTAR